MCQIEWGCLGSTETRLYLRPVIVISFLSSTGKRHGTIILDPLNIYLMLLKWWHKQDCLYLTWQREINLFLHWSISLQYDGLINVFFDPEVRPIIIKQLHCHLHSCNTNWFLAHRTFYWCNENIYKFEELF